MEKIKEKITKEFLDDTNLSEEQKKLIKLDPRIEKVIQRTIEEIIKLIESFKIEGNKQKYLFFNIELVKIISTLKGETAP